MSAAAPVVTPLVPPAAAMPSGVPSVVKKRWPQQFRPKPCVVCKREFTPNGPKHKMCGVEGCPTFGASPHKRKTLLLKHSLGLLG